MDVSAIKAKLASEVKGIETLTVSEIGGRLVAGFNGLIAAVDPSSTEDQMVAAIRSAANLRPAPIPAVQPMPAAPVAAQPEPQAAPTQLQPKATTMSVTGASHAGMSLKGMLDQHRKLVADAKAHVETQFGKLGQAAQAMQSLGDDVGKEADDLLATIGQFKNDLTGESGT